MNAQLKKEYWEKKHCPRQLPVLKGTFCAKMKKMCFTKTGWKKCPFWIFDLMKE